MTAPALSLSLVQEELDELRKDREAFARALDILRHRVQDSLNTSRSQPPLHKWSGSRATIGSLEMALTIVERSIEEHFEAVRLLKAGEIPNADEFKTPLGVIEGGNGE